LSLRKHQHLDAEPDSLGHGRQEAQRRQRLENRQLRRIGAGIASLHRMTHHDVIEEIDLIEADRLGRSCDLRDRFRPVSVDDRRELQRQSHARSPCRR